VYTWIDASTQVILPFIIMVICNVNIIHKVLLTKKKTNGKNLKRLRKIKGMCIMIVTVSIIFFVLEAPVLILICLIQGGWVADTWPFIDLVWTIVNLMMYTNHVINFFTYAMAGTKFRRELLRLLSVNKILKFLSQYKVLSMLNNQANSSPLHTALPGGKTPAARFQPPPKSYLASNNKQQQQQPPPPPLNNNNNNNNDEIMDLSAQKQLLITASSNLNVEKSVMCLNESENALNHPSSSERNFMMLSKVQKASRLFAAGKHATGTTNINLEVDFNNNNNNNQNMMANHQNAGSTGQGKPVNLTSLIVNKKALIGESAVIHHRTHRQHRHRRRRDDSSNEKQKKSNNRSSDSSSDSSSMSSSGGSVESHNQKHAAAAATAAGSNNNNNNNNNNKKFKKKKSQDVLSVSQSASKPLQSQQFRKKSSKAELNSMHSDTSETKKKTYNIMKSLTMARSGIKAAAAAAAEKREERHVNIVLPPSGKEDAAENIRMNPVTSPSQQLQTADRQNRKDDLSDDKSDGSDSFF
jgi:uncharacterized membrane protein YgcG